MADVTVTAADVKPLVASKVININLGAEIDLGEAVFIASDGDIELADAAGAASTRAIGVLASAPRGQTTGYAGDRGDVVVYGPVGGFTGLTPGQLLYSSVTAGAIANAVPAATNYKWIIGFALSSTVLFVNPFTDDTVVLS
jgi:hypothetical protein